MECFFSKFPFFSKKGLVLFNLYLLTDSILYHIHVNILTVL